MVTITWLHAGLCSARPALRGRVDMPAAISIRLDPPQPVNCTSGHVTALPNSGLRPAGRRGSFHPGCPHVPHPRPGGPPGVGLGQW